MRGSSKIKDRQNERKHILSLKLAISAGIVLTMVDLVFNYLGEFIPQQLLPPLVFPDSGITWVSIGSVQTIPSIINSLNIVIVISISVLFSVSAIEAITLTRKDTSTSTRKHNFGAILLFLTFVPAILLPFLEQVYLDPMLLNQNIGLGEFSYVSSVVSVLNLFLIFFFMILGLHLVVKQSTSKQGVKILLSGILLLTIGVFFNFGYMIYNWNILSLGTKRPLIFLILYSYVRYRLIFILLNLVGLFLVLLSLFVQKPFIYNPTDFEKLHNSIKYHAERDMVVEKE